jgi:NAD(P)-dependent dehydrogenase (short-subunit alcohol dehydrogenase family)
VLQNERLETSFTHTAHYDVPQENLMSDRLAGKVAVITGAASGIGAGTARRFAEEGARVVLADIQDDAGQALAEELGDVATYVHCDVTSEADVAAAVNAAVSSFGRLDVMFNNAGIVGAIGPIADTPIDAWDRTINILLRSVFLGMKHASGIMIPQRSGSIISTSSTAGILGGLGPHVYTAAKHGVIGLTKSVASELARDGIRVNAISPGNTVTAMTAGVITGDHLDVDAAEKHMISGSALGIAGQPSDIANAALYLASDESRNVTAHTLVVDAGQTTMPGNGRFHKSAAAIVHEAGRRDTF